MKIKKKKMSETANTHDINIFKQQFKLQSSIYPRILITISCVFSSNSIHAFLGALKDSLSSCLTSGFYISHLGLFSFVCIKFGYVGGKNDISGY